MADWNAIGLGLGLLAVGCFNELAQLRHLYAQMVNGHVTDTAGAARGLLGPAIARLEKLMDGAK